MKAQTIALVVLIVLVFLFLGGMWGNLIVHSSYSTSVTAKEVSILRNLDQIEAVKLGIDSLANYTILQAFYNAGKSGGWDRTEYQKITKKNLVDEDYPLWRNYSDVLFPYEKLTEVIKSYAKEVLKMYSSDLDKKFEINLKPETIILEKDKNSFYISLTINSSTDFYKIEDNSHSNISFNPIFFEMYDKSKEIFLDQDLIQNKIKEAKESLPESCKNVVIEICKQDYPKDAEEVLNENCQDADKNFENLMIQKIEGESKSLDDFDMNLKVAEDKTKHTSTYSIIDTLEDSSCQDNTKYKVQYIYDYFGAAKVFVNITTKQSFPLYDEKERKADLRKIILKFSVVSGNDYSWRPV